MNLEKQQQAHDLYFATGKTQQQIADILDVSRKTINGWIRKNRWDEMKAAARQMPTLILQDIYTHINAINDRIFSRAQADRCPTVQEVGMLHKLLTMTKSIEKKHTGSYIEAFQELQLFIFNRDSALAMQLREQIADYARGTLGDKGFMARKRRKDNVLNATAILAKQEMREQAEEEMAEECNNDVTFCNNSAPLRSYNAEETPAFCQFKNSENSDPNTHHGNQEDQANQGSDNVTFCNPDEQPAANAANTAKVFTVATNGEITLPQNHEKSNKKAAPQKCQPEHAEGCHPGFIEGVTFTAGQDLLKECHPSPLPKNPGPPSPFIDGDTVWILDRKHLENKYDTYGNPWGPMKIGYSVRYYPDVDPANTKAA